MERERLTVIPNGMDPALFRASPLPEPGPTRRLLYVGTLADWQGLLVLLKALPLVRKQVPAELTIVGSGRTRQRRRLSRWVSRLGLTGHVFIEEPVTHGEIPARIAQADVCVAPLGYNERNVTQGCRPLKVIEYMACGRPVVAANLPVIRELLRDGIEGLLFESDSVEELAAQITRLLLEPTLAAKLGAHAARRAHSVLRWDSAQRSLLAVYDRLLGTSLLSAHRSPAETPVSGPEWPHEAASLSAV